MLPSQADAFIGDYLGSEQLLFLPAAIKEHAEGALQAFFAAARQRGAGSPGDLKAKDVEAILFGEMGRLALPAEAKRGVCVIFGSGRAAGIGMWWVAYDHCCKHL